MERGRCWRRHKSDCHYLRILKRQVFNTYFRFMFNYWGDHGVRIYDPRWIDKISSKNVTIYKSVRTTKWRSRNKIKWGKKGKKNFDWSFDPNTRPKQKVKFLRELKEYGY